MQDNEKFDPALPSGEFFDLAGRYIDGSITESEAIRLMNLVENSQDASRALMLNVLLDLILKEKIRRYKNIKSEYGQIGTEECGFSLDSRELLLNTSVPLADSLALSFADTRNVSTETVHVESFEMPPEKKMYLKVIHHLLKLPVRFMTHKYGNKRVLSIRSIAAILVVLTLVFAVRALVPMLYSVPADDFPTIARVNETIDAVWAENVESYQRGQFVNESLFQLQSGMVQLEMNNGTILNLEGPVSLTVVDAMKSFCATGKVHTIVSKRATGYEIATPNGSIIDRGTEFLIDVTREKTRVDVVRGKVDYCSSAKKVFSLFPEQGLQFDISNHVEKFVKLANSSYLNILDFDRKAEQKSQSILDEKREREMRIANDPTLLVRFDLANVPRSSSRILNQSIRGSAFCPELKLSHCNLVKGEWRKSSAIDFAQSKGNGKLTLPGSYRNLRIDARVRINRLRNEGNVLLTNDTFLATRGSFQIQILRSGELQLQITTNEKEADYYVSPPIITKNRRGTWFDLSVVFDYDKRQIRMSLDGENILTTPWRKRMPIVCGELCLGNTNNFGNMVSSRSFGGMVSQLTIYDNVNGSEYNWEK